FCGKLAIHPDQVAPINAAFTPTEEERAHARRVVAAFAAAAGAGVASLDGQMIDRPHLLQAQRVLAAARARGGTP
ncbi:MAG TPA: HpcH/HpaI aldolase/citrate lyase family protein, partial [Steroidobacteraceae bacterium]|nr:HpcH/HpaI aldolase/citrate lyase family protein [Steroidobacteraceae bacterium]